MFLRVKKRKKDEKVHRYWSVVENRRINGRKKIQRQVLYLGELNDTQRASWVRAIEVLEGKENQLHPVGLVFFRPREPTCH